MKTFAFYNLKGGVGKTAAAVNMAFQALLSGHKTLIWDLDPQGAATWYVGSKTRTDLDASAFAKSRFKLSDVIEKTDDDLLDLIPAEFDFRHFDLHLKNPEVFSNLLAQVADQYDVVVLDCPPSLSNLAENIFASCDLLLIPTIPTHLSIRALDQIVKYFRDNKINRRKIRPFFSMVDRRRLLHKEWIENPPKNLPNVLSAYIPYASIVEKMGEYRAPLEYFASSTPANWGYRLIWQEIAKLEKLNAPDY